MNYHDFCHEYNILFPTLRRCKAQEHEVEGGWMWLINNRADGASQYIIMVIGTSVRRRNDLFMTLRTVFLNSLAFYRLL